MSSGGEKLTNSTDGPLICPILTSPIVSLGNVSLRNRVCFFFFFLLEKSDAQSIWQVNRCYITAQFYCESFVDFFSSAMSFPGMIFVFPNLEKFRLTDSAWFGEVKFMSRKTRLPKLLLLQSCKILLGCACNDYNWMLCYSHIHARMVQPCTARKFPSEVWAGPDLA